MQASRGEIKSDDGDKRIGSLRVGLQEGSVSQGLALWILDISRPQAFTLQLP
jgi:hypothetical protein